MQILNFILLNLEEVELSALNMVAVCFSETLVSAYKSTRNYKPED
jgi:hypothetical protein